MNEHATESDVREWLAVVAAPESVEARLLAESLILGAFQQRLDSSLELAAEILRPRRREVLSGDGGGT